MWIISHWCGVALITHVMSRDILFFTLVWSCLFASIDEQPKMRVTSGLSCTLDGYSSLLLGLQRILIRNE